MKNKENIKTYIEILKAKYDLGIEESLLEKDYYLSLFLSNWKFESTPNLDDLIFKGGTLLTKNYLNYHRISEDLDFTHSQSNAIRLFKKGKRDRKIKQIVIPLIEEIKFLAVMSGLDFKVDRTNQRYIKQRNTRSLYVFNLYYISIYTRKEVQIKFEISFVEDITYLSQIKVVSTLENKYPLSKQEKALCRYNLCQPQIASYPIEEIILEKIRAVITREQFKPRDIFDLYLLNYQRDIFSMKIEDVLRKLKSSPFEGVEDNIKKFIEEEIILDIDEIRDLSLIEYNEEKLIIFSTNLINYLKEILKKYF